MVTGNAWRDEEVQHTLRMLELMKRTDVPVVPGAVFPLGRIHVEQYAYLATRLDSMKEGNGTVLGNTCLISSTSSILRDWPQ